MAAARMLCPADEPSPEVEGWGKPPAVAAAPPSQIWPPAAEVPPVAVEDPNMEPPPALHSQLTETRDRALRSGLLGRRPFRENVPVPPPPAPVVPVPASAPAPAQMSAPDSAPAPAASSDPEVPPGFPPGFASPFALAAPSVPPPFQVPLGSLPVRVRALTDWLREQFAPESLFIADDQGQPLLEWRGGGEWLAAASLLAEAAKRAQRHLPQEPAGTVLHLPLGNGKALSLVGGETPLGYWRAGLVSAQPLNDQQARMVARALKKVAEGEPPGVPYSY